MCLLLTRSGTLFTIFEANVTASGLRAAKAVTTASSAGNVSFAQRAVR